MSKIWYAAFNEDFVEQAREIFHKLDKDVIVTVWEPDLVPEMLRRGVSVILGRGATAERIRGTVDLPVVDIPIPFEDMAGVKGFQAAYSFKDICGGSSSIDQCIRYAKRYAHTDLTVLLLGETGSGKEMFAQSMHNASSRRNGPFVAVNCAALPEGILESELFGYDEGAFTGARRSGKMGLFELSHNGTIFLDEIGEMPMSLQSRLLRVLQERRVMRLGGDRVFPVNIRIFAATNQNLIELVQKHKFREDLFYRLNVLTLKIPPLRERPRDIPPSGRAVSKRRRR